MDGALKKLLRNRCAVNREIRCVSPAYQKVNGVLALTSIANRLARSLVQLILLR